MRSVSAFALLAVTAVFGLVDASLVACQTLTADTPAPYDANPLGDGLRIAEIQNPNSTYYKTALANGTNGTDVLISSAVVSWIDTYDETHDGKSVGTVYIQDVGSTAPYAAIDVYEPSYVPASLRLLPGDVLDWSGPYEEAPNVGSATFTTGTTWPQLSKPVGTFRYEFQTPPPVTVPLSDINVYATGRKWENMLVTIEDVIVGAGSDVSNRVSYPMGQGDAAITANSATITNELYDLGATDFPAGTHFQSVTGIVTWFYTYSVAPRSAADLVVAQ
jgi:hypothetical protein